MAGGIAAAPTMNSRRHRLRDAAWTACAMALLCAAAGVSAQMIHRQIDVAGRVTYTDRPDTAAISGAKTTPALDVAAALAGSSAMSSRYAATVDANEAARRLRQTERERERGAERLSSEQAHAGDASAANDRYRRRQETLRHGVEQAQRRSSETGRLLRAHL